MAVMGGGLVRALECMLLLAVLYEPLRQVLHLIGAPVGGVGGVGGLVNLDDPKICTRLSGLTGNYCFFPGVFAGFTAMALIVTGLWCAPLLVGAATMALQKERSDLAEIATQPAQHVEAQAANARSLFSRTRIDTLGKIWQKVWICISWLWFVVPLVQFLSDPFFRSGFVAVLCAVSLAASYALSWHLAIIAIPVSDTVAACLGIPRSDVLEFHKTVGRWTAIWGTVHAVGQMIWFIKKGLWTYIKLTSPADGENVLYVFGIVTAVLLLTHMVFAAFRKQQWLAASFKKVHRVLACVVLLAATVHWWPFVLFLLPAVAVHSCTAGETLAATFGRSPTAAQRSWALIGAFCGGFIALAIVWSVRQTAMIRQDVDMVLPFIFPPLALVAEGFLATIAALLLCAGGPKAPPVPQNAALLQ